MDKNLILATTFGFKLNSNLKVAVKEYREESFQKVVVKEASLLQQLSLDCFPFFLG